MLFCNGQTLQNMCHIDKLTIDSTLKSLTEGLKDLVTMNKSILLDFKFMEITIKN